MTIPWELIAESDGSAALSVPSKSFHARGDSSDSSVAMTVTTLDSAPSGGTYISPSPALRWVDGPALRWRQDVHGTRDTVASTLTAQSSTGLCSIRAFDDGDPDTSWSVLMTDNTGTSFVSRGLWYTNGKWIFARQRTSPSTFHRMFYSDDMRTWSQITTPSSSSGVMALLYTDRWVISTSSGTNTVMSTGSTVSNMATYGPGDFFTSTGVQFLAYDGSGTVVGAGEGSALIRSASKGASGTWSTVTPTYPATPTGVSWSGLTYFNGLFIGTGSMTTNTAPFRREFRATSPDGSTWTVTTVATGASVLFMQNQAIASNTTCVVWYLQNTGGGFDYHVSTDGTTWTYTGNYTERDLNATGGAIYRSRTGTGPYPAYRTSDGVTWTYVCDTGGDSQARSMFAAGPGRPPDDHVAQIRTPSGWADNRTWLGRHRNVLGEEGNASNLPGVLARGHRWGGISVSDPTLVRTMTGASWSLTSLPFALAYGPWVKRWVGWSASGNTVVDDATELSIPQPPVTNTRFSSLVATSTQFVALRHGSTGTGTRGVYTSPDGETWTLVLSDDPANFAGYSITAATGWSLAYARDSGVLMMSGWVSGVRRILTTTDLSSGFTDQGARGNPEFVIEGDGSFYRVIGATPPIALELSLDGVTWTTTTLTSPESMYGVFRYVVRTGEPMIIPSSSCPRTSVGILTAYAR